MSLPVNSQACPQPSPLGSPGVLKALALLLEGYVCAQDLASPVWDFALEMPTLLASGGTPVGLRWLEQRGYAESAALQAPGKYGPPPAGLGAGAVYPPGAGFVLTERGAAVAREVCALPATRPGPGAGPVPPHEQADKPRWDAVRGELRLNGRLVKRFRKGACHQRVILDAMQRRGWPECLKDPLPRRERGVNLKQRLRNAIKNLNRHHESPLLRFHSADGAPLTGSGGSAAAGPRAAAGA